MSTEKTAKAVLDTNILVSSALSNGKPSEILKLAEDKEFLSITSPAIVKELRDVLTRDRLPFTEEQVDELVSKTLSISFCLQLHESSGYSLPVSILMRKT